MPRTTMDVPTTLPARAPQGDDDEPYVRLTRDALAEVDAGRVADHATVLAWATSLSREKSLPVPSCTAV